MLKINAMHHGFIKSVLFSIIMLSNVCQAEEDGKKGICNLDRTVESITDVNTWVAAKSRASSDWIPVTFNSKVLYLGVGNDKYLYFRRSSEKLSDNIENILYERSIDGSSIMISSDQKSALLVYGKTSRGPFFLGNCAMK
jgi:hypothetical protein